MIGDFEGATSLLPGTRAVTVNEQAFGVKGIQTHVAGPSRRDDVQSCVFIPEVMI